MSNQTPNVSDFLHTTLGRTGQQVFRLGLSGRYRPGEAALRAGIEAGMNYLFCFYWDKQMIRVLREVLPAHREKFVVATGVGNMGSWLTRRALEGSLRKIGTEYIDVFHIFRMGAGSFKPKTLALLQRFQEEGKIKYIAISTHNRLYGGELVRQGVLDVLMMRYNAAHRGAEQEIFPHLPLSHPGVVSYTATRWGKLLKRPRRWPASERIPTAGDCYRFVLGNPNVDVCLTAPRSGKELEENLAAVAKGALSPEDMTFMRRFGDVVHQQSWYRG